MRRTIAILLLAGPAFSHGGLDRRIQAATEELEKSPHETKLLAKRAELFREHEDFERALADLEEIRRVEAAFPNLDYLVGRVLFQMARPALAIEALSRFIVRSPTHGDSFIVRARSYRMLGRNQEAAKDYTTAISLIPHAGPDYYLERAETLVDVGNPDEAIAGLKDGVARLGAVATLVRAAVAIERGRGRHHQALAWFGLLPEPVRASPKGLLELGDLVWLAGRSAQARQLYQQALHKVSALPFGRQSSAAMRAVEGEVQQRLLALHRVDVRRRAIVLGLFVLFGSLALLGLVRVRARRLRYV